MLAEPLEKPPMTAAAHRATFFRQSGWLMFANVAGGVLMWAVHLLNKALGVGAYGSFGFFLAVVMLVPTIPLQMVLAQQTAKALADDRKSELSGIIRMLWLGTSAVWLLFSFIVLVFQSNILARCKLTDPVGLWITLPIILFSLWTPMFWGVLQGQQNFLWLGWSAMVNAICRLTIAAVAVLAFAAGAAGMMAGVLLGIFSAAAIAGWQTRSVWLTRPEPFDWHSLLRQIVPLVLAFLGFQILFTADTILVKAYFDKAVADFYVSAGTLSRALMWLVLPLAAVMFPRIVHSAARAEKTNLMSLVLLGTAVLAAVGALALSVLGPWVVRFVYKPEFVKAASSILPWYASAMVPLALANVLLNNLLARPASKLLLSFCVLALALGYLVALTQFHSSPVAILKTMGICNLLLLALCAWFSRGSSAAAPDPERALIAP
jgi:O-antigen/teichoic acid export membrane protein